MRRIAEWLLLFPGAPLPFIQKFCFLTLASMTSARKSP